MSVVRCRERVAVEDDQVGVGSRRRAVRSSRRGGSRRRCRPCTRSAPSARLMPVARRRAAPRPRPGDTRLTATWMPASGSGLLTDQSLPAASARTGAQQVAERVLPRRARLAEERDRQLVHLRLVRTPTAAGCSRRRRAAANRGDVVGVHHLQVREVVPAVGRARWPPAPPRRRRAPRGPRGRRARGSAPGSPRRPAGSRSSRRATGSTKLSPALAVRQPQPSR